MKNFLIGGLVIIVIAVILFFTVIPSGRALINEWRFTLQKTDDSTLYETRKQVEDTCRAMIASYEADKLVYIQYKDSDNTEKQSWAEEAKMRANQTATTYNSYIIKNSFVWKDNVPTDIYMILEVINGD